MEEVLLNVAKIVAQKAQNLNSNPIHKMTKLSASSGKKGGLTTFVVVLGFLALVGLIVGLTSPTENGGASTLSKWFANAQCTEPCVPGSEDIMSQKGHGTSEYPVVSESYRQKNIGLGLQWSPAEEFRLGDR